MSDTTDTAARPIRVLVAKPGLDGHDVGAKVVCRALTDAGMDVRYSGLRQSPEAIAEAAAEGEVDVVGLSVLSGAHLHLCRKVGAELERRGLGGVVWIVGGNVPASDHALLEAMGVDRVFNTGTRFDDIVDWLRQRVRP